MTISKFCVATDSGCDLPASFCTQIGIAAYHMRYSVQEQELTDHMDPSQVKLFYEKMRQGAVPKTSQINPYEFIQFWTGLWQEQNVPIVHISLGSGISGTYSNAILAKRLFLQQFPEAEVFVVDSTLASIGYGMLAIKAAEMRDQGKTAPECVSWLEQNKININTYYTTDDLTYLFRSGRVSRTQAIVGNALSINPILNLDDKGHLIVREKTRGRKKAVSRIYDIVTRLVVNPGQQTVYICHSDCPQEAQDFSQKLISKIGFKDSFINYIGPTIGSHSGPGLIAAFFYGQPRTA
ncbi:MAG: DegV family protein [Actinomycetota bacterium]|nr:DegV family protein [Actinomycetota bacterium]